jgi:predicted hydrocarbon binding protein
MHGIIFSEFKKFITTRFGENDWLRALKKSKLDRTFYMPFNEYLDKEIFALVSSIADITGRSINEILEDFGVFIVPDLLNIYKSLVKPEWKTIDFLMHTEKNIHSILRTKDKNAKPPAINCKILNPDEVVITYNSRRKMCSLAKGIIKGIARHYNERIFLNEEICMYRGYPSCIIKVKVI